MFTTTFRRIAKTASVAVLALISTAVFSSSAHAASSFGTLIETTTGLFQGTYANSFVNPADGTVALASSGEDIVTIIDGSAGAHEVVTDANNDIIDPFGLAFSPDGADLYVANFGAATVAVIDTTTNSVVDTIATENSKNVSVAISPDGETLLVGDDFDELTAYDLTNNASLSWSVSVAGNWNHSVYFNEDGTALLVDYDGAAQTVTLSNGALSSLTASTVATEAYSSCANEDHSVIAVTGMNQSIYLFDGSTWASLGSIDLSAQGANAIVGCAFTSAGQILAVDWNYSVDGEGQVFIADPVELAWIETVYTPGVVYTNSVAFLDNCTAVISGYYTNAATLILDENYCAAPEPEPTEEALADTGANADILNANALAAVVLLFTGAAAVVVARRRNA